MEQQLTFDGAPPVVGVSRAIVWDQAKGVWGFTLSVTRWGQPPISMTGVVTDVISLGGVVDLLDECEARAWLYGAGSVRTTWRRLLKKLQAGALVAESYVEPRSSTWYRGQGGRLTKR